MKGLPGSWPKTASCCSLVELIEASRLAVYELIDALGAFLQFSVAGVAGEKHQGRKGNDIMRHGTQEGKCFPF